MRVSFSFKFPKPVGNSECMWLLHKIATPVGHYTDNSVGL